MKKRAKVQDQSKLGQNIEPTLHMRKKEGNLCIHRTRIHCKTTKKIHWEVFCNSFPVLKNQCELKGEISFVLLLLSLGYHKSEKIHSSKSSAYSFLMPWGSDVGLVCRTPVAEDKYTYTGLLSSSRSSPTIDFYIECRVILIPKSKGVS